MRGKVYAVYRYSFRKRITPAYAGKSLLELVAVVGGRDHPRLCGEKLWTLVKRLSQRGSPPPMRGKGISGVADLRLSGITPAYAGKRHAGSWRQVRKKDHPRLCGEKPP